ncbi:MAG: hypothetical protein NTW19_07355 [Planctomycetota bacterium]|nr:hypothetical protein [Planctomycetota bacterium]
MSSKFRGLAVLFILGAASLGGCATYVNIPAIGGDGVAAHDTNWNYVADAMAAATNAVVADHPINKPFIVLLPKGSTVMTYNRVLPQLGEHATWLGPELTGAATAPAKGAKSDAEVIVPPPAVMPVDRPVLDVNQVRIRGWTAQIDIVRPFDYDQPEGVKQVVTAYMKWDPVSHWQIEQLRVWRTSVETALRKAPYAEPAEGSR